MIKLKSYQAVCLHHIELPFQSRMMQEAPEAVPPCNFPDNHFLNFSDSAESINYAQ